MRRICYLSLQQLMNQMVHYHCKAPLIRTDNPLLFSPRYNWHAKRLLSSASGSVSSMSSSSSECSGQVLPPCNTSTWQVAHKASPPQVANTSYDDAFNISIRLRLTSLGTSIVLV